MARNQELRSLVVPMTGLLVASFALQDVSFAQQVKPQTLDLIRLTAHATADAVKSADLRGTYELLNEDGTTKAEATVRIRFSDDKFLTEINPTKGFRYDRILTVADKTGACEATFSERIRPNGCHGDLRERRNLGEKAQIGDGPFLYHEGETPIWLQGPLLFYHVLNSIPFDGEHTRAERTKDGQLVVGTFRPAYDESGEFVTGEFEARPDFGNNISKFSISDKRGGRTASSIQWKGKDGWWFVEEFEEKNWYKNKFKGHTRIRFKSIEVNKELPPDTFSMASLGLVEGTRILDRPPNQRASAFNYVSTKRKGGTIRADATRQERY